MNNGQITDTVLHWAEEALGDVGEAAFAVVMYLLFLPLSFLIPSTSGLATVAMPIMAPLADFAGANRSLVVTAYQSASGLLNLVTPTSAVVMGGLAIARVPYGRLSPSTCATTRPCPGATQLGRHRRQPDPGVDGPAGDGAPAGDGRPARRRDRRSLAILPRPPAQPHRWGRGPAGLPPPPAWTFAAAVALAGLVVVALKVAR